MPGLLVSGTTRRSAERKLRDGIALYLEELALKGNPAPVRNTLDAAVHLIDVQGRACPTYIGGVCRFM